MTNIASFKENGGSRFKMFYDKDSRRFIILEYSTELHKYFVLEYHEDRPQARLAEQLTVTMYTLATDNSAAGRG